MKRRHTKSVWHIFVNSLQGKKWIEPRMNYFGDGRTAEHILAEISLLISNKTYRRLVCNV